MSIVIFFFFFVIICIKICDIFVKTFSNLCLFSLFWFDVLRGAHSIYLQHGTSPYHMLAPRLHAQYSSYNPVSRQDSELQSLSSDARTESDNMSLTDSSVYVLILFIIKIIFFCVNKHLEYLQNSVK